MDGDILGLALKVWTGGGVKNILHGAGGKK